jgi:uncharacterized protein YjbJ (UPF0337 family)
MTRQSTVDTTKGKLHEVKGAVRQQVGKLTDNQKLEANGRAEKIAGKAQSFVGKIEKKIGD